MEERNSAIAARRNRLVNPPSDLAYSLLKIIFSISREFRSNTSTINGGRSPYARNTLDRIPGLVGNVERETNSYFRG